MQDGSYAADGGMFGADPFPIQRVDVGRADRSSGHGVRDVEGTRLVLRVEVPLQIVRRADGGERVATLAHRHVRDHVWPGRNGPGSVRERPGEVVRDVLDDAHGAGAVEGRVDRDAWNRERLLRDEEVRSQEAAADEDDDEQDPEDAERLFHF